MTTHTHSSRGPVTAAVIVVSDRSARGEREDASGPRAVELLAEAGFEAALTVVPDGAESVREAIRSALQSGACFIVTSGGTGVGPRDETPEGTRPLLAKELPGVAEALRAEGLKKTPMAALTRGLVGVAGAPGEPPRSLVANLPGSVKAVTEGLGVLLPLVPHILDQLDGGDH